MKFLDQAKVYVRSGDGGAGSVSFLREKFVEFGGPNGGNGGRGGNVVVECVDGLNTLIDYRYQQHFKAQTGTHGMGPASSSRRRNQKLPADVGTQVIHPVKELGDREGGVEMVAADIVEIDIDALWRRRDQALDHRPGLVIDYLVRAQ